MSPFLNGLRRRAGLSEVAEQVPDEDDLLAADDARLARETSIEAAIRIAFQRIDLRIEESWHAVSYDEDADREARVVLDDFEFDLHQLDRLHQTGLAERFVIRAGRENIEVSFRVNPDLDHIVR